MFNKKNTIKVTVDKSHLFTLGEKMYRESIEFIRELVNNAYDADATEVQVMISEDKIMVKDNGGGMNEKGFTQFFTIGSEEKQIRNVSPKFRRKRIGQFGIGKFSALALANQFIIESRKGNYKYSVVFDRKNWQESSNWELPIQKIKANPLDIEGTEVILNKLIKKISIVETEKYLRESVPLRAKKFNVFLNKKRIMPKTIAGKVFSISIKTMYGLIEGEIVIALNHQSVSKPGLECRVKQVLIKRDLFEMEKKYHRGLTRITGSINADFLPLISSRSDFITDSEEYKLFYKLIQTELNKVLHDLQKKDKTKNLKKITKELQDIMKKIREALVLNPDFVPQGKAIARLKKDAKQKNIAASADFKNTPEKEEDKKISEKKVEELNKNKNNKEDNRQEKKEPEKISPKPLVVRKIRLKNLGISCAIVSLGENASEVISQGNIVYINQDHNIYQKLYKKHDVLSLHLLRLVTQEIVLMKKLRITAREAFEWQSKLLTDALK